MASNHDTYPRRFTSIASRAVLGCLTMTFTAVGTVAADRDEALARLPHFSHLRARGLMPRAAGLEPTRRSDAPARDHEEQPALRWAVEFGTSDFTGVAAVAVDGSDIYALGDTSGELPGETSAGGIDLFLRKFDRRGRLLWTRQFGSVGDDFSALVIAARDGAVYVAGGVAEALPGQTFAGGECDAFLRRYDARGNEVWTRQFGTDTCDDIHAVAVHHGRVFVAGSTQAALPGQEYAGGLFDGFLRAYDEDGSEKWTRQFGTDGFDHPLAAAAADDAVYVGGWTDGTLPGQTSAGFFDAFVRKYDRRGRLEWTRQFGTEGYEDAYALAADEGAVYVHGNTEGALPGQTNAGQLDQFVRKYGARGGHRWTRQYGTPQWDSASGMALHEGRLLLASLPGVDDGTEFGSSDAGLRSYDIFGRAGFAMQFGTDGYDAATSVGGGRHGEIIVGGSAGGALFDQEFSGGFADGFVAQFRQRDHDR